LVLALFFLFLLFFGGHEIGDLVKLALERFVLLQLADLLFQVRDFGAVVVNGLAESL